MPWFDEVNVDELEDTPESVKKILKDAAADAKNTATKLADLETKINTPAPPVNTPVAQKPEEVALNVSLTVLSDQILMRLENSLPYFKVLQAEIRKELLGSPLNLRADEGYVRNVYDMVKGRRMEEINDHNSKREGKYFSETPSATVPVIVKKTGVDGLTEADKAYCIKNKINLEAFAKSKETLKPVVVEA